MHSGICTGMWWCQRRIVRNQTANPRVHGSSRTTPPTDGGSTYIGSASRGSHSFAWMTRTGSICSTLSPTRCTRSLPIEGVKYLRPAEGNEIAAATNSGNDVNTPWTVKVGDKRPFRWQAVASDPKRRVYREHLRRIAWMEVHAGPGFPRKCRFANCPRIGDSRAGWASAHAVPHRGLDR